MGGIDSKILNPINTWNNRQAFIEESKSLARKFIINFKKYESNCPEEVT
jgi:phosphoenolpyruvate carboxykinase (ATP)